MTLDEDADATELLGRAAGTASLSSLSLQVQVKRKTHIPPPR